MVCSLTGMVWVLIRHRRIRAAWYSGLTAEGRCLRAYEVTTTRRQGHRESSSSSLLHVYEFSTPDGRTHRFEEAGSATVFEGDAVVVRYPAGRPDRATATPPGDGRVRARAGGQLAALAFFTLLSLAIGVVFFTVAKGLSGEKKGDGDSRPPALPSLRPPSGFPEPPPGFPALPPP